MPWRRIIKISIITVCILTASWFLLPPILDNTPIVKAPLEAYLSKQFNAPVELGQFAFTTWNGSLDATISSMDIIHPKTNRYIAQCDDIRLKLLPWQLFFGTRKTKRLHIGRIQIISPMRTIEEYLKERKYISMSYFTAENSPPDTELIFKDIDMEIKSNGKEWIAGAEGSCDLTMIDNAGFQTAVVLDPTLKQVRLNPLHIRGTRRLTQRYVDMETGELIESEHETPLRLTISGRMSPHEVTLPHITLNVDNCQILSRISAVSNTLDATLDIHNQTLTNLGHIFRIRTKQNMLEGIDLHIKSRTDTANGNLVTDGILCVRKGVVQNLPFSDGSITVNFVNDRLTSLMSHGDVWSGNSHITLFEDNGNPGNGISTTNRVLRGKLVTRNVDLNAFLSRLTDVPARSGGEISMDYHFELANTGISEFLTDRSQLINRMRGTGYVSISNCYLKYFTTDRWQLSRKIPTLLKNYLSLSANLTGTGLSLPIIQELLKEIDIRMPRELKTRIAIEDGALSTPEIRAVTPLGIVSGEGTCEAEGELDYRVGIQLNDELMEKYGQHPLLAFFMENERIVLPIRLTGSLSRPQVDLDMTEEERAEFEEEAIKIITAYVQQKLTDVEGEERAREDSERLEKTIRSIIRKFLY
jgi:hypothetical protein